MIHNISAHAKTREQDAVARQCPLVLGRSIEFLCASNCDDRCSDFSIADNCHLHSSRGNFGFPDVYGSRNIVTEVLTGVFEKSMPNK
jgi:hypothetical protein